MLKRLIPLALNLGALLLCFSVANPAMAANSKNKSTNPDESQPVAIHSDSAEFDDKKGTASYYGHVIMEQGSRRLTSDTLIIKRDGEGKIESLVATGKPAQFQAKNDPHKPPSHGHGSTLHYFPKEDKIVLIHNAEVSQSEDSIRGDHLTYYISKKLLTSEPVRGKRTTVILAPRHNQGKFLPKSMNHD